ncbi:Uu.00g133320.m01.CDS01 [Anthostomella pinea]|uniref:Uu.00g133320.m01.CDS01 n=1 Tax=Anthostomella pinea TaxID=933095 RepID=A0AAI8VT07_9PEZI|nr:Uu.00g133320.m01.CDS01 [Anthostomella pinea]
MCHGHPHYHPCRHTSVKWLYCPEAVFDLDTGYETPCSNPIYSTPQPTSVDCPLQSCNFKPLKGSWICCVCGQGPNTQGWCTTITRGYGYNTDTGQVEAMDAPCSHGCCSKCTRSSNSTSSSPELSFSEIRKGKSSRKGHSSGRSSAHKRGTTNEFGGSFAPVVEEEEPAASSSSTPSYRPSRKPAYDQGGEYSSKKAKGSSSKRKSHKSRSHH